MKSQYFRIRRKDGDYWIIKDLGTNSTLMVEATRLSRIEHRFGRIERQITKQEYKDIKKQLLA